ncbi:MAG TPA: PBP1A family penicillin-binding protein, partial [Desulfobacterales bacterium]|nr:PBP1A family penicillin-binding protein [Desulfobacterales bacterium]
MFKLRFTKTGLIVALGAILALTGGALVGAILALTRDLPQIRSLEGFSPSAVTRIYSADGLLLAELFQENRDPVEISQIPADLISALLTTEDRNFYHHSGVDPRGVLRAAVRNLRAGAFVEGASTISQQLAKTLFLTPKKTLVRKLREAILAFQLERRYTKDEILTLYLNQIYLGSGAYGVAAAARRYFDKPVTDLELAECALIAGLPKAPSRYSPLLNPDLALARRNLVLRQMRDTEAISAERYHLAISSPLAITPGSRRETPVAPYFIETVKAELEAAVGPARLYREGLRVATTLSSRLQTAAESALGKGLETLNGSQSPANGGSPVEGALICLDIRTGGILALVGGADFSSSPFNRATAARRQPGSAFKPMLFACAVEQAITQASPLLDAPVVFRGADRGRDWAPAIFSPDFEGEIPLRRALAASKNIPAVRLMEKVGPQAVVRFAHRLGIESPLQPNLTLALGASEVTLAELTAAYAVFARQGNHIRPFGLAEVQDRAGRVIWRARPQKSAAMSREDAAITTDLLTAVTREGTGRGAGVPGHPLAGKTGTTDEYRDALFVGFSPEIAAGVWVGRDDRRPIGPEATGARSA